MAMKKLMMILLSAVLAFSCGDMIEIPDVTISGPSVLCPDDSATLTVVTTTATAYLWSTGDTISDIVVSPITLDQVQPQLDFSIQQFFHLIYQ